MWEGIQKNDWTVRCRCADEPIIIDGHLDDSAWKTAENIDFYIPVTGEEPISKTEAKVLWDDRYLYVGFRAYDKDIWGYLENRDDPTCQEDVLEIFIKTDPEEEPYYNFEINALGTIYDAYSLKTNAGGENKHRWRRWNCNGLKAGLFIQGEINNPEVIDEYWQLEVAIPFGELPSLQGQSPKPGDTWMFHLARYDYSIHLPDGVELMSCAPLTLVNFHHSADWIPLKFEE